MFTFIIIGYLLLITFIGTILLMFLITGILWAITKFKK